MEASGTHDERARASKIVVVGPGEAGKSTLIRLLADNAINLEVRGRTVAMDHGVLWRGERRLVLVGVPGQQRFAGVREALVRGARGALWVHPAGEAADDDTIELLAGPLAAVPYLVYVNVRAGGEERGGFPPSRRLGPPRGVVTGSLADPGESLGEIEAMAWKLTEAN